MVVRIPRAAKTLTAQIEALYPKAEVTPEGEPDGYGRTRSLRVDKKTGKELAPILDVINDRRILNVASDRKGLLITFTATASSADNTPFPLKEVRDTLSPREDSDPPVAAVPASTGTEDSEPGALPEAVGSASTTGTSST